MAEARRANDRLIQLRRPRPYDPERFCFADRLLCVPSPWTWRRPGPDFVCDGWRLLVVKEFMLLAVVPL